MLSRHISGFLVVCLAGLLLTGISSGTYRLNVQFENVNGLVVGGRVLLDDAPIGSVRKIDYETTAVFTVHLSIDKDFVELLTEHSRFAIVADPRNRERMAVEVIQTRLGGTLLENGATVEGSGRYQVLLEMMQDDAKEGIAFLKKEYQRFSNDLRSLPEREKIKELKERITRLGEELKKTSKETRDKIVSEIIPMLEEEIDELRDELGDLGREEEVAPVEEALEKIKYI